MGSNSVLQLLHAPGFMLRRAIPEDDHELVAGKSRAEVVLADRRLQDRPNRPEGAVACLVPVGIVDFLQSIEIEHDDADRGPGARGVREAGLELPIERSTVRQPGQIVVPGLESEKPKISDVGASLAKGSALASFLSFKMASCAS